MRHIRTYLIAVVALGVAAGAFAQAQATSPKPADPKAKEAPKAAAQPATPNQKPATPAKPAVTPPAKPGVTSPPVPADAVTPPTDYVIGPDDVLAVLFWREKDLSVEQVAVRPDGKITLPLLNDVQAAGLTPDQLREAVQKAAAQYVEDPNATIVVRQINSRRFFVTGQVGKPGPYPLGGPLTVLQALSLAGGTVEFAKTDKIIIMRTTGAKTETLKFNYKDVMKGKNLQQNILLKPGDTILVP